MLYLHKCTSRQHESTICTRWHRHTCPEMSNWTSIPI